MNPGRYLLWSGALREGLPVRVLLHEAYEENDTDLATVTQNAEVHFKVETDEGILWVPVSNNEVWLEAIATAQAHRKQAFHE